MVSLCEVRVASCVLVVWLFRGLRLLMGGGSLVIGFYWVVSG